MDMPLALLNRRRRGGASFEKTLFNVPGSRGFFYDFSDYSTMFGDTAGTTPVTGVGQSVGLVLDESRGLVRGPELLLNGSFSDALSGWTSSPVGTGTVTVVAGQAVLQFNTSVNRGRITQQVASVAGRSYEVLLTVVSGTPNLFVGTTTTANDTFSANGLAAGSYRFLVTAGSAFWLTVVPNPSSTADAVVDNISVRELPGNHATQATAGSRALTQVRPMGVIPRNLLTYSEAFDNAVWLKVRASITANAAVAPDGTTTADKLVEDTSASLDHRISQTFTSTLGATYTYSVYAKAAERSQITLWESASGSTRNVLFDLAAGTATPLTGTGLSPQITAVGNGWFRCSITVSSVSNTSGVLVYMTMAVGGVMSYTGDGTSGVLFWGAQLEVGSTASTYQPTGPALINGEKRNLLTFTEQFDDAAWSKSQLTVTANSTSAPNGTATADTLVGNTANTVKFVTQSGLPSTIGTFTVYAKAAGETVISLWLVGASVGANFTLTGAGSTALQGATSSSITFVGDGWYRCQVQHSSATTTAHIYLRTGSTYVGDGVSGVHIWGAQFEAGPTPTAYQRVVSTDEWYEPGFTSFRGIRFDGSDDFLQTAAIDFAGAESLGPELVTNGDFSAGTTGWSGISSTLSVVSGALRVTATTNGADASGWTSITTVAGRSYKVTATLVADAATGNSFIKAGVTAGAGSILNVNIGSTLGTYSYVFTAVGTTTYISLATSNTVVAGETLDWDNVSVKEVLIPADKMTVVAGVRKLSDAALSAVVEVGVGGGNGTAGLGAPGVGGGATYRFLSQGTIGNSANSAASFPAPDTAVITGLGDISGDSAILRRNGVQVAQNTADQGTGNYVNDIVYIGRRGGTTLPFNGVLTFLCVINRTLTASELAQLEAFANSRTGAY